MALTKRNISFIDGYNVINKWSELKELSKINLADARDKLIEELAEYKSLSGEEILIVFDAYNLDRIKETVIEKYDMKIVFTKRFQTADSFIERQLAKIDSYNNIKVVTDDGAVQTQATSKGAMRVTAYELKADLNTLRNKIKRKRKENFNQNFKTFPISDELSDMIDKIREDLENND